MVNPRIVESQMESGIVFGLSAALWGGITLGRGAGARDELQRLSTAARERDARDRRAAWCTSDAPPGGIGELAVGPVAPAICNALFAATGRRIRSLPLTVHGLA